MSDGEMEIHQDDDDFVWMGHSVSGNERFRFGREFTGLLLDNSYNVNVISTPVTNPSLRPTRRM